MIKAIQTQNGEHFEIGTVCAWSHSFPYAWQTGRDTVVELTECIDADAYWVKLESGRYAYVKGIVVAWFEKETETDPELF